ncbi:hypothetical protein [Cryobacterium sp. N19]|uniref:hypothetical protein n=1 Tax=Cryobacterium sp. N19 TaxID=2048288 RepID=UPI001124EEB2|nr:hypothetical protein [Cryobacterium sp. N19]
MTTWFLARYRGAEAQRLNVGQAEKLATASAPGQDGMSLVELIIYTSLAGVILTLVGGFLVTTLRAERELVSAVQTTNTTQVIVEAIRADVRNANQITVRGQDLLIVKTAGRNTDLTWTCQAWFFHDGSVYSKETATGTPLKAPNSSEIVSWTNHRILINEATVGFNGDEVELSLGVGSATSDRVDTTIKPQGTLEIGQTCFAG